MTNTKPLGLRLFALVAVFAMVMVACTPGAEDTTTTGEVGEETTTTAAGDGATTTAGETGEGGALDTYTVGIFQDMTTDSTWAFLDTCCSSVWNSYVIGPTTAALYDIAFPGIEVVPELAAGPLEPAVQEGDVWVGTITLRDDATWSDGEAITAQDFAFTWNTAVEFELTANWTDYTDSDIVTAVEAVDDTTLQVTFNAQPGLAVWGLGNSVPFMPAMPEHFWGPVVEEARAAENPRDTLLAASGAEAPASGETVFEEREAGSFAASSANETFFATGEEVTSGDATYTVGPFAQNFNYPLYGGQDPAVLALANGEVDFLLNPLGMQRGFQEQVADNPDLTAVVNAVNGYRFLAFNHARAPMSDAAFRDAFSVMINKEYVTQNLLQGVAFPLYVLLPEGNQLWYNEEVATELAEQALAGADDDTRRAEAIGILTGAGYSWPEGAAPGWYSSPDDPEATPEYSPTPAEGFTYAAATANLIGPDGTEIEQLTLLHPTAGYDPLRATFGGYIAGVAREIGIPLVSAPTDFNQIIDIVFATDENQAYTSDYDMFILGYSLGNPVFPTFHGSFFATTGGSNNTQYSNEEFDALAASFEAATDQEAAFETLWELERMIARDKPHVPLFDTGILEFYNNRVQFPFTETLSGLQFIDGAPDLVQAAR